MSDRIVVMNAGVAEQVGDPFAIYNRPATHFVASFVGTLNALEARVIDPAAGTVSIDGQPVALARPVDAVAGTTVSLALRPEAMALGPKSGNDTMLRATVEEVSFLGSVVRVKVRLATQTISLDSSTPSPCARRPWTTNRRELRRRRRAARRSLTIRSARAAVNENCHRVNATRLYRSISNT